MHPTEPKNAFLTLRGNGWSLGRISKQLNVPKSTLFNWESEPLIRRTLNVFKALQLEKLQEKYIPSAEEELTRLSICLARLESALDKHDFDQMRPEFLLRASLQVRSRLHKFRSDVQPCRTLDEGELRSNPLPGCISRSETSSLETEENLSPAQKAGGQNGTISHENKISFRPNDSEPTTSTDQIGTIVPNSEPETISPPLSIVPNAPASDPAPSVSLQPSKSRTDPDQAGTTNEPPSPGRERYGDLAIPLSTIPRAWKKSLSAPAFSRIVRRPRRLANPSSPCLSPRYRTSPAPPVRKPANENSWKKSRSAESIHAHATQCHVGGCRNYGSSRSEVSTVDFSQIPHSALGHSRQGPSLSATVVEPARSRARPIENRTRVRYPEWRRMASCMWMAGSAAPASPARC